jgi:hypothetical protein
MKQKIYSGFKVFSILYLFAILIWNSFFTFTPSTITQLIIIDKIEKGSYSPQFFDYFRPFDMKIKVKSRNIDNIYASSSDLTQVDLTKTKSIWVNIKCVEASSWKEFFMFGFKFNYRLVDIPKVTENLKNDSIEWTYQMIVVVIMFLIIFAFLLLGVLSKKNSAD